MLNLDNTPIDKTLYLELVKSKINPVIGGPNAIPIFHTHG